MVAPTLIKTAKLVTVFGGSGFVGRYVAKSLAEHGYRVRIASRRPGAAFVTQVSGKVGQINAVQANLRYPDSVARAVRDADAVVNLVGILAEGGKQTFSALQAEGVRIVAEATKAAGITRFVRMSAIGADPNSAAEYGRTKAEGERLALSIIPEAVIVRPSIVFGPEDKFFNRFAGMARVMPALPLIGGGTGLLQPVFVGDVAAAIALAVDGKAQPGTIYELGGPEAVSFADIMRFILKTTERKRPLVKLPFSMATRMAGLTEMVSKASFGLMPEMLEMTQDQVELLKEDNVVSEAAKREGRTLQGLGIRPESYESFVPRYLGRYRKTGQYAAYTTGG